MKNYKMTSVEKSVVNNHNAKVNRAYGGNPTQRIVSNSNRMSSHLKVVDLVAKGCSNKSQNIVQKKVDIRYENLSVNNDAVIADLTSSRLNMPIPFELLDSDPIKSKGIHNRHIIPDSLIADFVLARYRGKTVADIKKEMNYKGDDRKFDVEFRKCVEQELSKLNAYIQNGDGHEGYYTPYRGGYKGQLGVNQWFGNGAENEKRNQLSTEYDSLARRAVGINAIEQHTNALSAFAVDFDPSPNMTSEEFVKSAEQYTNLYNELVKKNLRVHSFDSNHMPRLFEASDVLNFPGNKKVYDDIMLKEQHARDYPFVSKRGRVSIAVNSASFK